MNITDAKPGDIYVDKTGQLYKVIWRCDQPTVMLRAIYDQPPTINGMLNQTPAPPREINGAITAPMWNDFERIYRPRPKPTHISSLEPYTTDPRRRSPIDGDDISSLKPYTPGSRNCVPIDGNDV